MLERLELITLHRMMMQK